MKKRKRKGMFWILLIVLHLTFSFTACMIEEAESLACEEVVRFVRVEGQKLMLGNEEFFVKGANYAGGRYVQGYIKDREGYERVSRWQIYHDFNESKIEEELVFLKDSLDVNTIRILTPGILNGSFDNLVKYHGWEPWVLSSGSINPYYLEKLKTILNLAKKHDLKVHIVLFLSVKHHLVDVDNEEFIPPGSYEEEFHLNHLRSLVPELSSNTALLSYEIGSEMLVNSNINYWEQNWCDEKILSFIKRMIDEIRRLDKNHLIRAGEVISPLGAPYNNAWHWPTPELALIDDIDNLNNGQPFSLYEIVDYISPHFYLKNLADVRILEIIRSRSSKPVILGEFGYGLKNETIKTADKEFFANDQKEYYEEVIKAVDEYGLNGLIPWDPMPLFELEPGKFEFQETFFWGVPDIIMEGPPKRKIRAYRSYRFEIFYYDLTPMPAAIIFKEAFQPNG